MRPAGAAAAGAGPTDQLGGVRSWRIDRVLRIGPGDRRWRRPAGCVSRGVSEAGSRAQLLARAALGFEHAEAYGPGRKLTLKRPRVGLPPFFLTTIAKLRILSLSLLVWPKKEEICYKFEPENKMQILSAAVVDHYHNKVLTEMFAFVSFHLTSSFPSLPQENLDGNFYLKNKELKLTN